MKTLSSYLACPACKQLINRSDHELICPGCGTTFPLVNGIPRFVPKENYAESFGLQWNRFASTQIDSIVGTNRSEARFKNETLWNEEILGKKLVLDAGCGSGRFSEIALRFGAFLIAVDYSTAVEAAQKNLTSPNKLIVQGDLANLPIANETFDYIYCIGVLQHTSEPSIIVNELLRCLKVGGEITFSFYENSSWHVLWYAKYLVRPITKRLPDELLLNFLERTSLVWFPITKFLFKLPTPFSRIIRFVVPIANYVEFEYKDQKTAKDEAVLDTFDMLSPSYDKPIKKSELLAWIDDSKFKVKALEVNPKIGTMRFKRIK